MAIYRLEAKIIGRATARSAVGAAAYRAGGKLSAKPGRSIVAGAAYRAGERLKDEGRDITFDYSKKHHVEFNTILAPADAPDWVFDRARLWNAVEAREDRAKRPWHAQLARELLLTLPRELSPSQCIELVEEFVDRACVERGMVADIAIHRPDASDGGEQPHAHVLLTMRRLEHGEFTAKARDWNYLVPEWRSEWADAVNLALEEAGIDERVDHRSLEAQGIDREPAVKLGVSHFAEGLLHEARREEHGRVEEANMIRALTLGFDPADTIMGGGVIGHYQAPDYAPDIGFDSEPRRRRRAPEIGQGTDRGIDL